MNLSEVIVAINAAPRIGKRINWSADLRTSANTACAIITAENAHMAIWNIYVDTGASRASLALLSRGCKPNGQVWPELRDAIQARGLTWRTHAPMVPRDQMTAKELEHLDGHALDPVMRKPDVVLVDQCTLDVKTRDILVITTRRIEFGTPAWCEKMVEINSKPKA